MNDPSWLANTVMAFSTLLSSLVAAGMAIRSSMNSREAKADAAAAKKESVEAKEQSVATHTAVNSGLDKLLKLIQEGAVAKATLDERENQAELKAAVNGAITAEREKAATAAANVAATAACAATTAANHASTVLGKPVEVEVVKGPADK